MDALKQTIADVLEVESVSDSDILRDFSLWDSLASLSIQALIEERYGCVLSSEQLASAETVGDLAHLVDASK